MNRNLKDDLEVVEKARQFTKITGWGSKEFHELSPYFSKFHEEGLDIAKHAIERALKAEKALGNETILNGKALAKLKERADKAEALVNELRSDSKTDDAVMEGQAKRIEELESLVQDLIDALSKAYDYITNLHNLYGENLEVYNWHLNGEPEPLNNFIDDCDGHGVVEAIKETLDRIKRHLEVD